MAFFQLTATVNRLTMATGTPTPADFEFETPLYVGMVLISIIAGLCLGLMFIIFRILLNDTSFKITRSRRNLYLSFEILISLLNVSAFVSIPPIGYLMWIVHRDEVTPIAYWGKNAYSYPPAWYIYTSSLPQVISMFLGDALLIYRCHVVFGSRLWMIAFPSFCSIGYLVLTILNLALANEDAASIIVLIAQYLMLIVNPMITAMISTKIIAVARRTPKNLYVGKSYTNVATILIESAAPWTVIGILCAIIDPLDALWPEGLYLLWVATGLLSPQLVIFRIVTNTAWDKGTSSELSQLGTLAFAHTPSRHTVDLERSGARCPTIMSIGPESESRSANDNGERGFHVGLGGV